MIDPARIPAWRRRATPLHVDADESLLLRKALDAVEDGDLPSARALLAASSGQTVDLDEVFRLYQIEVETQAQQLRDSQARAEQALEWFSNLFRTLPVASLLVDRQGLIVDANEQALQDLGLRGALRTTPMPLRRLIVNAGDESRLAARMARMQVGATETLDDLSLHTPDGRPCWADLRITQVPARADEGGDPLFLCVFNDRTARVEGQRAREAAARAEFERDVAVAASQSKTQLLSRVSHELRTPLNAVIGFSSLMLDGPGSLGPEDRKRLGHILAAGKHLLQMVDDILEINQADGGRLVVDLQPLPMRDLARSALDLHEPSFSPKDLTVTLDVADDLDDVALADPKRTREVIDNLLSNAVKFNRDGGWIAIRLHGTATEVCLEIADSGQGLSADQLAHLFEPFNRLGADRTRVEGYGLGLAIARSLAQAMGGRLTARSRPGWGSTFELSLRRARTLGTTG